MSSIQQRDCRWDTKFWNSLAYRSYSIGEKKKGRGEMAESNLEDGQFGDKGDCIRHWTERNTELKDKMVLEKPKKRKKRPQQKIKYCWKVEY